VFDCFNLAGTNQWVVVSNGLSITSTATPPPASDGGSIVAVETCAAGDASCLGADTQHNFAEFSVYYPPDPSAGGMKFLTTMGTNFVDVADGSCGGFALNTNNGQWYALTTAAIATIGSGSLPPAVTSPSEVSGAAAISNVAPPLVPSSCFTNDPAS